MQRTKIVFFLQHFFLSVFRLVDSFLLSFQIVVRFARAHWPAAIRVLSSRSYIPSQHLKILALRLFHLSLALPLSVALVFICREIKITHKNDKRNCRKMKEKKSVSLLTSTVDHFLFAFQILYSFFFFFHNFFLPRSFSSIRTMLVSRNEPTRSDSFN